MEDEVTAASRRPCGTVRRPEPSLRERPSTPLVPLLALGLVAAVFVPSLGGGWVWDDHLIVAGNPALDSVVDTVTSDVFGPATGTPSDAWRPLAMLSHVPGRAIGWGPTGERLLSLALHLLSVTALALAGRHLGARPLVAWLAALFFGLHPATAELVAWISGRHDLLALLCLLAGTAAWTGGRPWPAALLLALAPWCKETMLVVPGVVVLWSLGDRRLHPAWLLPPASVAAFVAARHALDLPIPSTALDVGLLAPLGGALARFTSLLLLPAGADALPLLHPSSLLGGLVLLAGLGLLVGAWGRRPLAAIAALLLPVLPAAVAMMHSGLASDRYVVPAIAALALGLGLAAERLLARASPARTRLAGLIAALLLLGLALLQGGRALDWTSDAALFGHSLARDPGNAHAAFHVAHDLHTRQDDCDAAVPLYRQGLAADPRAGTNLLACLVALERYDDALAEGPAIARATPSPAPAASLARAASLAGQLPLAQQWAQEAVARDADNARNQLLLGKLLAQGGQLDAAAAAFSRAAALAPNDQEAPALLARVQALQAAEAAAEP